jgi:hypothetical protein
VGHINTESKDMLLTLAATMALRAIASANAVDADQLKIHDDQKVEDLEFHIDVVVYCEDRSVSIVAQPKGDGASGLFAAMGMVHVDTLDIRIPYEWIPGYSDA